MAKPNPAKRSAPTASLNWKLRPTKKQKLVKNPQCTQINPKKRGLETAEKREETDKRRKHEDDEDATSHKTSHKMPPKMFHQHGEFHGTLSAKSAGPSSITRSGVNAAKKPPEFNIHKHQRLMIQNDRHKKTHDSMDGSARQPALMDKDPMGAAEEKLTVFIFFRQLPPELRNMVWKFAAQTPRLVRWGREIPAIFHVNWESRGLALWENKIIKLYHNKRLNNGIYINPERDILYRLTPLPTHQAYRADKPRFLPLFKSGVKRLALPLDDCYRAARMSTTTRAWNSGPNGVLIQQTNPDNLWKKVAGLFPDLRELLVFTFPNPKIGDEIKDFWEIDFDTIRSTGNLGGITRQQYNMMRVISDSRAKREAGGKEPVELTFVKKSKLSPGVHCTKILES